MISSRTVYTTRKRNRTRVSHFDPLLCCSNNVFLVPFLPKPEPCLAYCHLSAALRNWLNTVKRYPGYIYCYQEMYALPVDLITSNLEESSRSIQPPKAAT